MTKQFTQALSRGLLGCLIIVLALAPSATITAYAADGDCTPPDTSGQPGVHKPTGSDAYTYTYNCDTGMWENAHYIYNPANNTKSPKDPVVYTYNPATGQYDAQIWTFSAPRGDYYQSTISVAQAPAGASVVGAPAPGSSNISGTGNGSNNTINNNGNGGGTNNISNTGAGSNNTIDGSNTNNQTINNNNQLSMDNTLNSQAQSGNALVVGNTSGGNATSGNAQGVANVINLLQSASSALGSGNVVTFVTDIDGDVNGDFMFDPNMLGAAQAANVDPNMNNNLTINNSTDAAINNDINLSAASGDATISRNTKAGNATTGNAQVVANVVNMINSAITSGKSFIGTVNINGNLNGDILMPPDLIDQLVAANVPTVTISTTGADSNNEINNNSSNNTSVTNTNNLGINNNVNASANSGNATVSGNTKAGDATSGNASTNITAFNLTGSNIIGSNNILVFVNVLGSWVGMIVNAPAGANVASLGSGISNTGANSSNAINNNGDSSTTINNDVNQEINNNITATATSGDALVDRNTNAGNAKSGDASSAVNLLNIQNSSLSLTGWFGLLFINVFGNWNGSFGINTAAGDPVMPTFAAQANAQASGNSTSNSTSGSAAPQVFRFVPNSGGSYDLASYSPAAADSESNNTRGAVLAAARNVTVRPNQVATATQLPQNSIWRTAGIIGAFVLMFIVSDALMSYRRNHKARG